MSRLLHILIISSPICDDPPVVQCQKEFLRDLATHDVNSEIHVLCASVDVPAPMFRCPLRRERSARMFRCPLRRERSARMTRAVLRV